MSRNATLIAVLFVLGAIGFVQAELQEADRGAPAERVVTVSNFPAVQTVAGTVNVGNLPAAARFQLVGFTKATFTAGQGVLGFTAACQAEFGTGSRMCSVGEVFETTVLPDLSSGATTAWVDQGTAARLAVAGITWPNQNCIGWGYAASGPFNGFFLTKAGKLDTDQCDQLKGVACCAPV